MKQRISSKVINFRALLIKIEKIIVAIIFSILIITVFLQVFFRYVLNNPLDWSEELARFLFIWLVYISSAIVLSDDSHMSMDFFVNHFTLKLRTLINTLGKIFVFGFLLLAVNESFSIIRITMSQLSPSLDIPMSLIYLALPVSFIIMMLDFITRIFIKTIKDK